MDVLHQDPPFRLNGPAADRLLLLLKGLMSDRQVRQRDLPADLLLIRWSGLLISQQLDLYNLLQDLPTRQHNYQDR